MVIIYVDKDESRQSSWAELHWQFGSIQERKLRGISEFIRSDAEIDIGTFWRDSECEYDWKHISLRTRSTLSHDQVIQWTQAKVTCLHWFRTMPGKNEW